MISSIHSFIFGIFDASGNIKMFAFGKNCFPKTESMEIKENLINLMQ